MKPLTQRALLAVCRLVTAIGILRTRWGRSVFEWTYVICKIRLEAGPVDHLRPFVATGTVVFDVGANFGFFTGRFCNWVGDGLIGGKSEMTEGDVCPDDADSAPIGTPRVAGLPKRQHIRSRCGAGFQDEVCSATIGADGGSYLGNVGLC